MSISTLQEKIAEAKNQLVERRAAYDEDLNTLQDFIQRLLQRLGRMRSRQYFQELYSGIQRKSQATATRSYQPYTDDEDYVIRRVRVGSPRSMLRAARQTSRTVYAIYNRYYDLAAG